MDRVDSMIEPVDGKTYVAPELIEHGSIEEITGGPYADNPSFGCSGERRID